MIRYREFFCTVYVGVDLTYNEILDKLVVDGKVSLRGLKVDAKVYDEMILDVNTDYFEQYDGYGFATKFFESAYRLVVKLYDEENNLSAVMCADELNIALTEKYGKSICHYHLHVVALPVVEKQIEEHKLKIKECREFDKISKQKHKEYKKASQVIQEIIDKGDISDIHLRMLVNKIKVHQNKDKSLDIEFEMNGNWNGSVAIYVESEDGK